MKYRISQKIGKIAFLNDSQIFKGADSDKQSFIYDSAYKLKNKKIEIASLEKSLVVIEITKQKSRTNSE